MQPLFYGPQGIAALKPGLRLSLPPAFSPTQAAPVISSSPTSRPAGIAITVRLIGLIVGARAIPRPITHSPLICRRAISACLDTLEQI